MRRQRQPLAVAVSRVEPPADRRPLGEVAPECDGVVVDAESLPHERMPGHSKHVVDRAPRAGKGEESDEQFRGLAEFAEAAVGHEERQRDEPLLAVFTDALHPPREHGLEQGCHAIQARAHDHHVVWLEMLNRGERCEDRVVDHLHLP